MGELTKAILLGIIEGLTEFVPVSSTGHLLLCERWMHINLDEPFWKMFTVFIQIGAILAVGYLFHKWVEQHMERPLPIALALLIGGLIMMAVEWARPGTNTQRVEHMTWGQAIGIGLAQVLAVVFPGTSRSGATIIAGMIGGLSRPAAAEFSFLLAIPAMAAASGYSLLKGAKGISGQQITLLLAGTLVSFVVAWAVIAVFMGYIRKRTFMPFGVYRIVLGVVVLIVMR